MVKTIHETVYWLRGFRVESVQYFTSGTVYVFMTLLHFEDIRSILRKSFYSIVDLRGQKMDMSC